MKKRFGTGRCCCGDGGGAGPCPDVCVDNWNSCPASASGLIYETEALARSNCGYFPPNGVPFFPGTVLGQDGNFQFTSTAGTLLEKRFANDFRTTTTYSLAFTSTVIDTANPLRGNATTTRLLFNSIPLNHSSARLAIGAPAFITVGNVFIEPANNTEQFRMDVTLGQTLNAGRTSLTVFNDSTGEFEIVDTCFADVEVTLSVLRSAVEIYSTTSSARFYGARCYQSFRLSGGSSGPGESPFYSDVTLTVT